MVALFEFAGCIGKGNRTHRDSRYRAAMVGNRVTSGKRESVVGHFHAGNGLFADSSGERKASTAYVAKECGELFTAAAADGHTLTVAQDCDRFTLCG